MEFNAVLRRADLDLLEILAVLDADSGSSSGSSSSGGGRGSSKTSQQSKLVQGWLRTGFPGASYSSSLHTFRGALARSAGSTAFSATPTSVLDLAALFGGEPLGRAMQDAVLSKLLTLGIPGSFQCGPFPVAFAPCDDPSTPDLLAEDAASWVAHNFFVARGAQQNAALGVADWLANATQLLVTGRGWPANDSSACQVAFAPAFSSTTGEPLLLPEGNTSTLAAAAALLLRHDDLDVHISDDSALDHSTVVALMIAELVFAFSVGFAFVSMSVALIQKLRSDNRDGGEPMAEDAPHGPGVQFSNEHRRGASPGHGSWQPGTYSPLPSVSSAGRPTSAPVPRINAV